MQCGGYVKNFIYLIKKSWTFISYELMSVPFSLCLQLLFLGIGQNANPL